MRFINDDGEPFADDQLWSLTTSDDQRERAEALYELAMRSARAGGFDRSAELLTTAVDVLERSGDHHLRGSYLSMLALVNLDAGRPEDALDCATAASEILREHSMGCELATAQRSIGLALVELERPDEARAQTEAALRLFESCDDHDCIAQCHQSLADLAEANGEFELALEHRRQSLAARQQTGDPRTSGVATFLLAETLIACGEPGEAAELLADLAAHWQYLEEWAMQLEATGLLGEAVLAAGDPGRAVVPLAAASEGLKQLGNRMLAARYDAQRVRALRQIGFDDQADELERLVTGYWRVLGIDPPEFDDDDTTTSEHDVDADLFFADDDGEVAR
jgi:tetratricopeptide (TPR) repeat protein